MQRKSLSGIICLFTRIICRTHIQLDAYTYIYVYTSTYMCEHNYILKIYTLISIMADGIASKTFNLFNSIKFPLKGQRRRT